MFDLAGKRPTRQEYKQVRKSGGKVQGTPGTAVKTRAALIADKIAHLYTYGTIGIYENDGTYIDAGRLIQGDNRVDLETDIATWKSEVLDRVVMLLVNDKTIERWNSTQQGTYEDLIIYGAQLLIELKNQIIQQEYVPTLTRSDSTRGSTFTRSTMSGLLASMAEIRIPTLSYVIAEMYTKVIQRRGPQLYQSKIAGYFQPFRPWKTYTEIETLIGTIISKYDAVVYASQIDSALKPFSVEWLYTINETVMASWYGYMLSEFLPIKIEDGGVTETNIEIDETTDIEWLEPLGIAEFLDGLTLFRSHGCASGDAPAAIDVVGIAANTDPQANKMSYKYASIGDSAYTEIGKAEVTMDFLRCGSIGTGNAQKGIWNGADHTQGKANILASDTTWNYKCAMWLAKHMSQPLVNVELYHVMPDMIVSGKRKSGGQTINYNVNIETATKNQSGPTAPAGPVEAAASLAQQALSQVSGLFENPLSGIIQPISNVGLAGFSQSFDGIMQDIDLSGFNNFSSIIKQPSFGGFSGGVSKGGSTLKLPW